MAEKQVPGGSFLNETHTKQAQVPGGSFINMIVTLVSPVLSAATYTPGSITITGFRPRVTATA